MFASNAAATSASSNELQRLYHEIDAHTDLESLESEFANSAVSFIPRSERWKLFIDARFHEFNDPTYFDTLRPGYDGDLGYMLAISKAFILMSRTMHQPLSIELILAYFNILTTNILSYTADKTRRVDTGFRTHDTGFGITPRNATPLGLLEAIRKYSHLFKLIERVCIDGYLVERAADIKNARLPLHMQNFDFEKWQYLFMMAYKRWDLEYGVEFFTKQMQILIDEYNSNLKFIPEHLSLSQKQALIIVTCVRFSHASNILHPFGDYNIRLFVFICVNRALLAHQLPAIMVDNPNCFDFYSVYEIGIQVLKGMQTTLNVENKTWSDYNMDREQVEHAIQSMAGLQAISLPTEHIPFKTESMFDKLYQKFLQGSLFEFRQIPGSHSTTYYFPLIRAINAGRRDVVTHYLSLGLHLHIAREDTYFLLLPIIELGYHLILSDVYHMKMASVNRRFNADTQVVLQKAEAVGRREQVESLIRSCYHNKLPPHLHKFTALHWAILFRQFECFKVLVDANANLFISHSLISPLALAVALDFSDILGVLEKALIPEDKSTALILYQKPKARVMPKLRIDFGLTPIIPSVKRYTRGLMTIYEIENKRRVFMTHTIKIFMPKMISATEMPLYLQQILLSQWIVPFHEMVQIKQSTFVDRSLTYMNESVLRPRTLLRMLNYFVEMILPEILMLRSSCINAATKQRFVTHAFFRLVFLSLYAGFTQAQNSSSESRESFNTLMLSLTAYAALAPLVPFVATKIFDSKPNRNVLFSSHSTVFAKAVLPCFSNGLNKAKV